jgi:hypothetical protein
MFMLVLALAGALQAAAPPSDARQVTLAAPQPIADVDLGKMKGDLARLAWSTDGSEFYVQTVERDRVGAVKAAHHYLVSAASKTVKDTSSEPAWATEYWTWKSAQASPASAGFAIAVDGPRRETRRSTAAPTGGALARGGTVDPGAGTTVGDVASAADQTQVQVIYALKVKNETLGEWVNEAVTPGANFSWAPAPLRLLAFTKRDGGPIVVIDDAGRKQELAGAKSAFLPAWSSDGKRLAWLERKDKKKYQLTVAEIAAP